MLIANHTRLLKATEGKRQKLRGGLCTLAKTVFSRRISFQPGTMHLGVLYPQFFQRTVETSHERNEPATDFAYRIDEMSILIEQTPTQGIAA